MTNGEQIEKIKHLNLVLKAVRNVNRLLVQEKDKDVLIQKVCDLLVETRGYYNAWIAIRTGDSRIFTTAESGLGEKFTPMLEKFKERKLTACGTKALKSKGVIVVDNPEQICSDCPLAPMYSGRGAMAVRFYYGGIVYGLLSVSIPVKFVYDVEEQELLKEIADDIAFGLHRMMLEAERNLAREALVESEKRFRLLIENSLTCISIIQNHKIVYQNSSETGLFGPISNAFVPPHFEAVHKDDVSKVKKFYETLLSGIGKKRDIDFRFEVLDASGEKSSFKWVYCRATQIDFNGVKSILINIMDATEAKEVENLIRIEDKMSSLGRVAAGIAHEIRNPLSGIYIYLNNLKKIYNNNADPSKGMEILQKVQSASEKIESIIKRVMDFSKPGSPKFILMDLNKYIEEAIQLSSVTLKKSNVRLEKELAEGLPLCRTDPQLIEEVILNLITNALEAMKEMTENKMIRVSSTRGESGIIIKVSDSGPGISPELKYKIFDPFYSTKMNSTGIGLSLCHRIITDHGGSLKVGKSKYGGAKFTIELPAYHGEKI